MDGMVPTFSIVIPVYNTVKELRRCVESITSQTYGDFEVILVDDGSKDGSGELCDELAREDGRIVPIHQQNSGCSEARNTGIRAAKSEYLIFVDSDDLWDEDAALENLHRIKTERNDPDVICFGVSIYSEDGEYRKKRVPVLSADCKADKESILRELIYTNQYFSTSYVKALKRTFFLEHGLFFVKGLLSEDIEWSARVMIGCHDLAVYPSAFYKRIVREEGSITSSIGRKNILDILGSIETGVAFAREHSENDTMLALYNEYWAYQYAMLLGLAPVMKNDPDYESVIERLKKLKWLLKYDHVKKVKAVRYAVSVIGVRGAMGLLGKYYAMK